MADFRLTCEIAKKDTKQRIVYGWASIIEKGGKPVVDHQKDVISEENLVKVVHGYVREARVGKAMHKGEKTGELVESIVFTKELQKALGIDLAQVGWFVGYKITDDATWAKVEKGELKSFSIGGRGKREAIKDAD